MTNGQKFDKDGTPITEPAGSSATTAVAATVGAVVGASLLVVAAPIVLPLIGLGALAVAVTPVVGAAIGGVMGWKWFGK